MNIFIIGCGGGASYLVPALYRSLGASGASHQLYLIDRDRIEARNRQRQNFQAYQDGFSKAQALKQSLEESVLFPKVEIFSVDEYIQEDSVLPAKGDGIIFAMVDNHPARKSALALADKYGIPCICAANEMYSAEAYYYHPDYYQTACDPRVMYPEILTDTSDDPTRPSCNEIPKDKPPEQGVIANFLSAAAALHLFQAHVFLSDALAYEFQKHLPFILRVSSYGVESISLKDQLGEEETYLFA